MASGERERRTGFASGPQTGPISNGQKLWRSRPVPSLPLPGPTHGHPAAPFPDTEAQGSQALLELTGLRPGGERSSHTLEGWHPLTETREQLPSTTPPSLLVLLQRTADISQLTTMEKATSAGRAPGRIPTLPGSDRPLVALLVGWETWAAPLTPWREAARQSDTRLSAQQDGHARLCGLYLPSRGTIRWGTRADRMAGMSCAESRWVFQQKEGEAQGRGQPSGFEEHPGARGPE